MLYDQMNFEEKMKPISLRIGKQSKIVSIAPLSDGSFLLEEINYSKYLDPHFQGKYQKNLLHINHKGETLWKHPNYSQYHYVRIIGTQEAVVFKQMGKHISLVNLVTHRLTTSLSKDWSIKIGYKIAALEYFQKSGYVCICSVEEKKRILRVNYYNSNKLQNLNQPLTKWWSQPGEIAPYSDIRLVDSESKIGWWKIDTQHSNRFIFYFCWANYPEYTECKIRKINVSIPEGIGSIRMQVLWQVRPHQFLVAARSQFKSKKEINKSETVLHNFIIPNSKEDLVQVHPLQFELQGKPIVLQYGKISRITGYQTLLFETINRNSQGYQTQLYYYDSQRQQIKFAQNSHLQQQIISQEGTVCLINRFTGWSVREKEVSISFTRTDISLVPGQDLYIHFLLSINPEFDEDLIIDAVSSLSTQ